jgi:PKD repeat protein
VFNLDEPVGGNYWSDWTGPDDDGDGFVDSPYVFTGGQDNLPWVNQDGWKKNKPPVANAGLDQVGNEGSSITFDASGSSDPDDDPLHYRWDFDNDGGWDTEWLTSPTVTHTWFDDWSGTVKLEVSDGELTDTDTATVTINNVAPTVGAITAPLDPVQVDTEISASAEFTDPGVLDTHTAVWDWGDGSDPTVIEITDGSRSVSGSHTYTTPGVYTVELTVTDKDSGSDQSAFQFVVVYDPDGGFVTGGGWINSPAGACKLTEACMDATGKANFGFVSKYKKGADTPTGETEFQFKAGNLNFHSNSYEWLVVAGHKAKYKGMGTINGAGNYGFMLSAIDAELTPSTDVDLFRIKIWDKEDDDTIVYDNQMGDADDADPATAIGGGSIVIHEAK